MGNFPFYRFPYRNHYYPYYSHYPNVPKSMANLKEEPKTENETINENEPKRMEETRKISSNYNSFANINFSNLFSSNLEEPILEILGIQLYLDDILILALLFFLYTEGVQDEILFITLILLLLS